MQVEDVRRKAESLVTLLSESETEGRHQGDHDLESWMVNKLYDLKTYTCNNCNI